MKTLKNIFVAALSFAITSTATLAQVDRSHAPEPGPAPTIELGESTMLKLANGIQLIVVENHRLPQVSWTLSLEYKPMFEGNKAGMIDLFGDLMQSGTLLKSKAELDEAVDFIGASLSASAKGIRGSSLTKHTDEFLSLMAEVILSPSFPESEWERLRTQALSGLLAAESSPSDISDALTRTINFTNNHPYGEITTAETLGSITPEDFQDYHSTYFHPNNAYLVVVGDIDSSTAFEKANTYFGNWKRADIPYKRWDSPDRPRDIRVCLAPVEGAVQTSIKVTHTINMPPGHKDGIAASVMNSILGGGAFSGRLMQNLREDKAFTYGARSSFSPDPLVGTFTAYTDVRNEVTDSAIVELLYEIKRITIELVDSASLALTKNYMSGSFARTLEYPNTAALFALNIKRYKLPEDYYSTYLQKLSEITVDDVYRVAKRYIHPDQINIACVGNPSITESLKQFSTSGIVELYDAYGRPLIERSPAAEGVTANSVITAHYEALGGVKAFSKLKGVQRNGSVEMPGGMNLQYLQTNNYNKKTRGSRTTMSMSGYDIEVNVVTDKGGFIEKIGSKSIYDGPELIRSQWEELDPVFMLHASEKGITTELQGVEEINGVKYHVISFSLDGSINMICYFDVNLETLSFSKSTIDGPDGPTTTTTTYKKYIEYGNGLSFPIEVVTLVGPKQMSTRLGSITINPEIDPSIFKLD